MIGRFVRPLDRYVFREFWRIFVTTALGFPVLVIMIDLTDKLDTYLNRNLPRSQIALSYLYWLPDSMFMILPAAVLFATVFSIGGFTRYSEITAAKASGISFYRFTAPIFFGALLAAVLGLVLGELVPITNGKREAVLQDKKFRSGNDRFNFTYTAERGRVYKVASLNVELGALDGLEIERRGNGPEYPTVVFTAQRSEWAATNGWTHKKGEMHILPGGDADIVFTYDSLRDNLLVERPIELMATPKAPQEMRYRELGRFIRAMERSGTDVNELRVERMLKIAIPVTCLIIAMFGAPLATSTQRGGAAYGIGVSLATTVVFLMFIQLTKAIGGKGIIPPELAAWMPNAIFFIMGAFLLSRART